MFLPDEFHLDRLRGWGFTAPKSKKMNFTNIIAFKGRVLCTIFTKFTVFMHVLTHIILPNLGALSL